MCSAVHMPSIGKRNIRTGREHGLAVVSEGVVQRLSRIASAGVRPATLAVQSRCVMESVWLILHIGSAYASAPHLSFTRIDGSFHFVMLDQPETFAAAVENFLR